MSTNKALNKTTRQKEEYDRMKKQLFNIDNWINKNNNILKKNCSKHNVHIFQLYYHYTVKAIRIKKQLHIN